VLVHCDRDGVNPASKNTTHSETCGVCALARLHAAPDEPCHTRKAWPDRRTPKIKFAAAEPIGDSTLHQHDKLWRSAIVRRPKQNGNARLLRGVHGAGLAGQERTE